jgi:hypothetical protein
MDISAHLGTFDAYNCRTHEQLKKLSVKEVVTWDHHKDGITLFKPSGDRPEVALVFSGNRSVTAKQLTDLCQLLQALDGTPAQNLLLIYLALKTSNLSLGALDADTIRRKFCQAEFFHGTQIQAVRKFAAHVLFERSFPKEHWTWDNLFGQGLRLNVDRFLAPPAFSVHEIEMRKKVVLVVSPHGLELPPQRLR